jgi:AcrR family transcriptional regulator
VTLRSIAAVAETNVAAVNYYFGSKEKLFEEMFLRRIVPLNDDRVTRLAASVARNKGHPSLEDVVTAFVKPALQLADAASASARAIVVQYSLGRVLAMPEVDRMLVRYYARVREAFVAALQQAVPHLAPQEAIWRYYWMGGSVMVALAVPSGMVGGSEDPATPGSFDDVSSNLIAFLVAGLRAPGHSAAAVAAGTIRTRDPKTCGGDEVTPREDASVED